MREIFKRAGRLSAIHIDRCWVAGFLCLAIGIYVGFITGQTDIFHPGDDFSESRILKGFDYTSPLLDCDDGMHEMSKEIRPFRSELTDYIDSRKELYRISHTSVYFRDLNNGPWVGINEKEDFSPASMLKVPLMMAVLKKNESEPGLLDKKVKFSSDGDYTEQYFKSSQTIKKGDEMSIDQLLYRMIVFSDNNAQVALFRAIGDEATARTYQDLGLAVPQEDKQENFMNVKDYASFFRVLYNASYLPDVYSEQALKLLAQVDFKGGIRAGVPGNVKVAHKFGERTLKDGEKQLHDCGIVYEPKNPYLICIMNRGEDFDKMEKMIEEISSFVFDKVDNQE